jgi:PTH1 family peptidyl-tRNA hydrolase
MRSDPLRLIVGLGNPGAEYLATRHNVGFWFLDALAAELGESFRPSRRAHGELVRARVGGNDLLLLKPDTFVNKSGLAVRATLDYFKYSSAELLVVHDDLDLPAGVARIKRGGGHGGHNGLRDIIRHIGRDFARLRFGIGHPSAHKPVIDYVLGQPSRREEAAILDAFAAVAPELQRLLAGDFEAAMRALHTREKDTRT